MRHTEPSSRALACAPIFLVAFALGVSAACSSATSGSAPSASSPPSVTDAGEGDAGEATHDCKTAYPVDPRDGTFADEPQIVALRNGSQDTALPDPILDWLDAQNWTWEHEDWHNVRRWDMFCRKSNSSANECATVQALTARGLWRAPIVEASPGDGYAFIAMHRHMLRSIREAFPSAKKVLAGFEHVPRSQKDTTNPQAWRNVRWSAAQLEALDKLEHIEDHLADFPTEDELGLYIQDGFRWTAENPTRQGSDASAGIHTGLHSQWSIGSSPVDIGGTRIQIYNSIFWKLHGWIDDVWQRYRIVKGIGEDDPAYVKELFNQCEEMHKLGYALHDVADAGSAPPETGVFATQVRPVFDNLCASCHSAGSPTAGLTLGGSGVSSATIRNALVGVKSSESDLSFIAPGDATKSWLFLKVTASFDGVSCGSCKTQMPLAGATMTSAEVDTLRAWIAGGATDQ